MEFSISVNLLNIRGGTGEYLETLRRYANIGLKHIDAQFSGGPIAGSVLTSEGCPSIMYEIRAEADRLGIRFVQCHLPFANIADPPSGGTAKFPSVQVFTEAMRRAVMAAGILGAPWAVVHAGTSPCYGDSLRANIEFYSSIMDLAAKNNLGIAFENLYDGCYGKGRVFCAEAGELISLVDGISAETGITAGICWDFGHGNIMYQNQAEVLSLLGSRLKIIHVHDNNGEQDSHIPPFHGTADWVENLVALKRMGYTGAFNFEVKPRTHTLTDEMFAAELGYLKTLGEYLMAI